MKKIIAVCLALIMVFVVTACGSGENTGSTSENGAVDSTASNQSDSGSVSNVSVDSVSSEEVDNYVETENEVENLDELSSYDSIPDYAKVGIGVLNGSISEYDALPYTGSWLARFQNVSESEVATYVQYFSEYQTEAVKESELTGVDTGTCYMLIFDWGKIAVNYYPEYHSANIQWYAT